MKTLSKIYLLLLSFIIASCAQILAPTGGERDVTPPKLLTSVPENETLKFKEKAFTLQFDEYFSLDNPNDNVLISPPLKSKPEFKIKGKKLIVEIEDSLKSNTTYSIMFSDCIRDITEGNKIPMLQYVFSTGENLDSAMYKGKLINAESLEPEKNAFVMLYADGNDTLPSTQKPLYITKTNEKGEFNFKYLAKSSYYLYALQDKNNNLLFDMINEPFAFANEKIEVFFDDELEDFKPKTYRMFVHADTVQSLVRSYAPARGEHILIFKNPLENPKFEFFEEPKTSERFSIELNATADTVHFYDKKTSIDTLLMKIVDIDFVDTLKLVTQQLSSTGRGMRRGSKETNLLNLSFSNLGELYEKPSLSSLSPIGRVDLDEFMLVKEKADTVFVKYNFKDSLNKVLILDLDLEPKTNYEIIIPDSVFWSANNATNDSIIAKFVSKGENDYGNFKAKLEYLKGENIIVKLLDDKSNAQQINNINSSTNIDYLNLKTGTYRLEFFIDSNGNNKWDTGNFRERKQAELKFRFDKKIEIKGGWDIEEEIDVDKLIMEFE